MITPKQERQTRKIELVETNNIALSLSRIINAAGWGINERWKRALYHALLMASCGSNEEKKAIREAMKLP